MDSEGFGDFVTVDRFEDIAKGGDKKNVDNLKLVPEEGYSEDTNPDESKKFTCKQCSKECKSELGVRQHITAVHKAMKRTADKSEHLSKKQKKETISYG